MNPENLKLIIDAVNHLGGNAKEAYTYYLLAAYGVEFLKYILGWAGGITLTYLVVNLIWRIVVKVNDNSENLFKIVRDRYKLGEPGPLIQKERERVEKFIYDAIEVAHPEKEKP